MFDDYEREVSTFLFDLLFAVSFEKHSEKHAHKHYISISVFIAYAHPFLPDLISIFYIFYP